jgi:hypothetical protein
MNREEKKDRKEKIFNKLFLFSLQLIPTRTGCVKTKNFLSRGFGKKLTNHEGLEEHEEKRINHTKKLLLFFASYPSQLYG